MILLVIFAAYLTLWVQCGIPRGPYK